MAGYERPMDRRTSSILICFVAAGCAPTNPPVSSPRTVSVQSSEELVSAVEFDAPVVVDAIRQDLRNIQECYESLLRQNQVLAGKVVVAFDVEERGTISNARATENTTGSTELASCVVERIRGFYFSVGPSGGSVSFSYPFVFAPQS